LLDLRRLHLGVRELVMALETAIINTVAQWDIAAAARRDAPGVYVDGCKLASIGLRIRRGCCYHGLAFNVAMDLQPFQRINPCGYQGLQVLDLATLGVQRTVQQVAQQLAPHLLAALGLPSPMQGR
jgi:lipoyl(octanoyl) transferase